MPSERPRRLRCGIVGYGFIGPHHADAIRRLGFVEIHGLCTGNMDEARGKADKEGIPKVYRNFAELAADPDIDVVDIAAPTHLHYPAAMAAIEAGKAVIVDKPLALSADESRKLKEAAEQARVANAVTFNYRYYPMVQEARSRLQQGEIGTLHSVHGHYLQEWLLYPTDFNWRVEAEKAGPAAMMGDAGCHWFDLVEYVTGLRVDEVLAELTTIIPTRKRPAGGKREAFAVASESATEDYAVQVPDWGSVLLRFKGGARGVFHSSALCAGHKNDLRFECNGSQGSAEWRQEDPEHLRLGFRDRASQILSRDPAVLGPEARRWAQLPGGHNESWADAFRNLMRDIFTSIATGESDTEASYPRFADGLRAAEITEAILRSQASGGAWSSVRRA